MDQGMQRLLRGMLAIGGVLGLLCASLMLLFDLGAFGYSGVAMRATERLPLWAQLNAAPPAQTSMLVAGFLCALLLVAGSRPIKVLAVLSAAWLVYAQSAFGSGSRWALQAQQTFDYTPSASGDW